MRYNLKTFKKKAIRMPDHPEVKKAVSFADRTVYINIDARPGANVILYEAPEDHDDLPPEDFLPWQH